MNYHSEAKIMFPEQKPKPSGAPMAKLVLVVAIIVSLGAVLGAVGYLAKNKPVKIQQPQVSPAIEPKPANQIIDDTADWKTYRNEEYGFEFKYPSTYLLKDQLAEEEKAILLGDKEFPNPDIAPWYYVPISIGSTKHENLTAMINSLADKTTSTIEISGVKADVIEGKYASYPGLPNIYRMKIIIIPKKDLTITIKEHYAGEISDWNEILTTTTKIISTFRFLDWQIFSIEEYGFSLKIHPDYTKKEEKEVGRGEIKIKAAIFSRDSEKITVSIDQSENIKMTRSALLDTFKEVDTYQEKGLENFKKLWGIIDPGTEVISLEKVEKGPCVGIQFIEKRGGKYERNLVLTSLNLKDMYLTVSFEYYKDSESEVLKMIETIECAK